MSSLSTLQRLFPNLDWEDRSEVGEFCGWLPRGLKEGNRCRAVWLMKEIVRFSDQEEAELPYPLYTVQFFGVRAEFLKLEEAIAWLRAMSHAVSLSNEIKHSD